MGSEGADQPHIIYQVDDPEDFKDRHITVVGSGDAGIENALGVAEEALENRVTILNRSKDFARAKAKHVSDMMEAGERSEERGSGKVCAGTCQSWGLTYA